MSVEPLTVTTYLAIPRSELSFRASRSGGAGGQHVNTSSTRIELLWNPMRSRVLTDDQRRRIQHKLGGRLDSDGNLRVVSSVFRSQLRNREDAESRLAALVRRALAIAKARKKTKPTKSSVEKRLQVKKHRADKKGGRRAVRGED